jgi:catalase
VDADGGERWVRYTWRPTIHESDLSGSQARERGRDYLFDDLRDRLVREPVRMELEVQIAEGDDDPHDPSSVWPDDRKRVNVGTVEVTAIEASADDSIVFDPMRLTDGIEPSDDEVLRYRPAVYDLSHRRRTGA